MPLPPKDSTTLIASAAIVGNREIISPATIQIENGTIVNISNQKPKTTNHKIIRLENTVLLPGFTNAHCHLELTGIGPIKDKDFVPWIKTLISQKK